VTAADAAPDLDRQIADVFALLGVLLVFVIAYLSAMFPLVEDAVRQPRPTVEADRLRLGRRLRAYRNLIGGLALSIVLIAVLLLPLSGQAVSGWAWPWQRGYRTTRAGLVGVTAGRHGGRAASPARSGQTPGMVPAALAVAGAVAAARRRIAAAAERAGRDPASVRLVAVSKTVAAERVAEAVAAGVTDLGENRVQEAAAKRPQLPDGVRWHMVGHLQTNKAARAAATFAVVHSVDSVRLAETLAARRPAGLGELEVLLEVELTGLPGHTGLLPGGLEEAVAAIAGLGGLRLRGLMTMAPPVADPEEARPVFAALRRMRDGLEQRAGGALPELSMGMSGDFEVAVEEGATMVRLGRAIFGERPPRAPAGTGAAGSA
jgi:pyridoxal phosphate enzyme (YggS family)